MRGATEARVLDAGVRPEEEDALLFRLPRIGRPADRLGRLGALRRLVRQKPEMLLIRAAEVRVDVAADGLGYGWRPVREKSLARLVVERLLSLHSGVELGVGGHLEDKTGKSQRRLNGFGGTMAGRPMPLQLFTRRRAKTMKKRLSPKSNSLLGGYLNTSILM